MFLNRRRERGAVDAERDLRVFALKFYTKEANWDMVGINPPVFFEVIVNQFDSTQEHDDYMQAGKLYRIFDAHRAAELC